MGDEDKTARVYAAMIRAPLDRGVGKVLQGLADTNQVDNTLVIFTRSDNGTIWACRRSIHSIA